MPDTRTTRMRETPDAAAVSGAVYRAATAELSGFVERIERVAEEIAASREAMRDIYAEAKARGYHGAALKRVIAIRRKGVADWREVQSVVDLYLGALDAPQGVRQ